VWTEGCLTPKRCAHTRLTLVELSVGTDDGNVF